MKIKSLYRRLLSGMLGVVMCSTLIPVSALASDDGNDPLYGITENEGTSITELREMTDNDVLGVLSDTSERMLLGAKLVVMQDAIWGELPAVEEYGVLASPFYMKAEEPNSVVSFSMNIPTLNTDLANKFGLGESYKIAVQDASDSNAPVLFFSTEEVGDNQLKTSIPMSKDGVNCALVYDIPDNATLNDGIIAVEKSETIVPNDVYENSTGTVFPLNWTVQFELRSPTQALRENFYGELVIKAPSNMKLDENSLQFDSQFLAVDSITPQKDGSILVELVESTKFSENRENADVREEMLNTEITISCNAILGKGDFESEGTALAPYAQLCIWGDNFSSSDEPAWAAATATTEFKTPTMKSAVAIKPANMTIYQGGDEGYEGVYDDGQTMGSDSLPHPLFEITPASGSDVDPAEMTFTNGGKSWNVVGTEDPDLYYFEPAGEHQDPVRVTYTDQDGNSVTNDEFKVEDVGNTYAEYDIDLYPGDNDFDNVRATTTSDTTGWPISVNSGTLTVRAVEKERGATSDIVEAAPTTKLDPNTATAVEPAGTTYTLNDTEVELPADHGASLLFDDIIESDGVQRVDALKEVVDSNLGTTDDIRHYEAKYLDLVDANNGNAWISSSKGTDIYWGYPAGTDKNTSFTLVHFEDLHRDGNNSGFDIEDIDSDSVDVLKTGEDLTNTDYGIKFHVEKGGFSPFVLVWETEAEDPGPTPTPGPGDDDNPPYIPPVDPDDTGVSDLLNTEDHIQYLFGYPDGTFGPENNMTRAEVAQMFYNLLLDQNVEITKTFDDVPEDAWYAKAVNTLASLGVVSGVGDNKFEPNRSITRAEFTTMAMKFAVGGEEGENIFSDVDEADWFYKAVVDSIQYGWIHGYGDGTFRPNNPITRAEVTAIVNNMLGREADEDFVDEHAEELTQFSDIEKHWAYYHIAEATNDHDYTMPSSGENWTRLN